MFAASAWLQRETADPRGGAVEYHVLDTIRRLSVGFGQGWLFSPAVPPERFAEFVRDRDLALSAGSGLPVSRTQAVTTGAELSRTLEGVIAEGYDYVVVGGGDDVRIPAGGDAGRDAGQLERRQRQPVSSGPVTGHRVTQAWIRATSSGVSQFCLSVGVARPSAPAARSGSSHSRL